MSSISAHHDEQGVTLVELLVVVSILTIVGAVVGTTLIGGLRTTQKADDRIAALDDLQRVIERTARELRATCWIDDDTQADDDALQVRIERGGDFHRFTYWVPVGEDVLMQRQEIWDTTAGDWVESDQGEFIGDLISNQLFTYYGPFDTDSSGTVDDDEQREVLPVPLADPTIVQEIEISVEQALTYGQSPIRVETDVHLRNDLGSVTTSGAEPCEV